VVQLKNVLSLLVCLIYSSSVVLAPFVSCYVVFNLSMTWLTVCYLLG
jgi:hypothetical protein